MTIVAEVGQLSRVARPRQLMGYNGAVSSENSTGKRIRRGSITRTGNAHLRRIVGEAAWAYRHRPRIAGALRLRQERLSEEVKEIAWKAQHRLHDRYRRLAAKGKSKQPGTSTFACTLNPSTTAQRGAGFTLQSIASGKRVHDPACKS